MAALKSFGVFAIFLLVPFQAQASIDCKAKPLGHYDSIICANADLRDAEWQITKLLLAAEAAADPDQATEVRNHISERRQNQLKSKMTVFQIGETLAWERVGLNGGLFEPSVGVIFHPRFITRGMRPDRFFSYQGLSLREPPSVAYSEALRELEAGFPLPNAQAEKDSTVIFMMAGYVSKRFVSVSIVTSKSKLGSFREESSTMKVINVDLAADRLVSFDDVFLPGFEKKIAELCEQHIYNPDEVVLKPLPNAAMRDLENWSFHSEGAAISLAAMQPAREASCSIAKDDLSPLLKSDGPVTFN